MGASRLDAFQVVAEPTRRQILKLLSKESLSINAIARNFDMSRPAVSKHVKLLEETGFIAIEEIGRERHCKLSEEGFEELREWMAYYDNFWKQSLHKLEALMDSNTPLL
ncbi:metalloregulator ArsR/SmtB family transcription factor [Pedobacter sp. Du54]|uniref:ArsR/SmtB family transcription factor n=1 Tax=Pedobacter anseongensis TaxID=3133439 RepID=UPI0030AED1EE